MKTVKHANSILTFEYFWESHLPTNTQIRKGHHHASEECCQLILVSFRLAITHRNAK